MWSAHATYPPFTPPQWHGLEGGGTFSWHGQYWDWLGKKEVVTGRTHVAASLATPRATSHTSLRARDHYTSSTLVHEKVVPVQVCFTLRLRDQHSFMWMQDGCKVFMDSYMPSNGAYFMDIWTIFKYHLLEVSLPQNHWETMTLWSPNAHNCWFILFYHVWCPAWIEIRCLVEALVTYDFTLPLRVRDYTTWFWRCVRTAFLDTFSFGLSWSQILALCVEVALSWMGRCDQFSFQGALCDGCV